MPGYRLPAGTAIAAGDTLRLRVGCGGDDGLHWCLRRRATFERAKATARPVRTRRRPARLGGSTRAGVECSDSLAGQGAGVGCIRRAPGVDLGRQRERLTSADLGGHVLEAASEGGRPDRFVFGYPFRFGTVIPAGRGRLTARPGRLFRVTTRRSSSTRGARGVRARRRQGRGEPADVRRPGHGLRYVGGERDGETERTAKGGPPVIGVWLWVPFVADRGGRLGTRGPATWSWTGSTARCRPEAMAAMLQAIAGRPSTLVRVARNEPFVVGQALDLGADGRDRADGGERRAGGRRCGGLPLRAGGLRAPSARCGRRDVEPLCLVMIETRAGVERAEEIAATPGLDKMCVGPSDLALTLRAAADDPARAPAGAGGARHGARGVRRRWGGSPACTAWPLRTSRTSPRRFAMITAGHGHARAPGRPRHGAGRLPAAGVQARAMNASFVARSCGRAPRGRRRALGALAGEPGVHVVGGAVRDVLLDRTPQELDIVVEGDARAGGAAGRGAPGRQRRRPRSVRDRDGARRPGVFDVVSARSETYARPGALPEVHARARRSGRTSRGATSRSTRSRCALADGALAEFPGARADLRGRRLRVLHDRSFLDDPTRLLRLARYAARLGFAADPDTDALAARSAGRRDRQRRRGWGPSCGCCCGEPQPAALLALARHGLGARR